jgi:FMN-dependent NADH-azoreductase
MTLFRLDASILPAASAGAEIADVVEAKWTAAHPGEEVVRRHLGTDPLPSHVWASATVAGFTPEPERTPAQREALAKAEDLVKELASADVVVLAVPFYNFGVSQHFKTWVDLVIAAAGPTTPVLKGKPTVRELTLAATTPGMEGLRDLAAELRTRALEEAEKVGTGIATT